MQVPPFERFYESHRGEIDAFLVKRLGRARAEDAFQETFLRALRAYDRLEHGRHLRAWVFTIASRVALDVLGKDGAEAAPPEVAVADAAPAYAELAPFTDGLPPKERAAVVLRYGYDLSYAQIGAALGSSEQAARAAASSGVRKLRQERTT